MNRMNSPGILGGRERDFPKSKGHPNPGLKKSFRVSWS